MTRHHTQAVPGGLQVEVVERPYRNHRERPVVEVNAWASLEERYAFTFEEVDPARRRLELTGPLLGTLPEGVLTALENLGYTVES